MSTFLILLLAVVAVAWVLYRMRRPSSSASGAGEPEDFNDKFLRNASGKVDPVELIKVYQPDDLSLLRSLLDAEGIETYVPESRMGALYPLSTIPGFADSTVTVYRTDVEAARQVVADYLAVVPDGGWTSPPEIMEPRSV